MATHPIILAQRIPWTGEPGRLQPTGSTEATWNGNQAPNRNVHLQGHPLSTGLSHLLFPLVIQFSEFCAGIKGKERGLIWPLQERPLAGELPPAPCRRRVNLTTMRNPETQRSEQSAEGSGRAGASGIGERSWGLLEAGD